LAVGTPKPMMKARRSMYPEDLDLIFTKEGMQVDSNSNYFTFCWLLDRFAVTVMNRFSLSGASPT